MAPTALRSLRHRSSRLDGRQTAMDVPHRTVLACAFLLTACTARRPIIASSSWASTAWTRISWSAIGTTFPISAGCATRAVSRNSRPPHPRKVRSRGPPSAPGLDPATRHLRLRPSRSSHPPAHLFVRRNVPPAHHFAIGPYVLPLSKARSDRSDKGRTFWEILAEPPAFPPP